MKLYVLLLLLTVLTVNVYCAKDCKTNGDYDSKSSFTQFFDECLMDTTTVNALGDVATQFQSWFNLETYPVYVTVVVFALTMLFFGDNVSADDGARGNCYRLIGYVMLMRLGFVISMVPWLWAALTQERPCVCRASPTSDYTPVFSQIWGMPSSSSFAATVVGAHFAELANIPLGVLFSLLVSGSSLVTGEFSLGQVIVGILFGIAVHFYTSRTPIFARAVDLLATIIAGIITLYVAKHEYPVQDFAFAVLFFVGITWQLYGIALVFVTYEWEFIRGAIRRSSHNIHPVDFMYYRPLNSHPSDTENKYPHETLWITVVTIILFVMLCGLRIVSQYMNQILSVQS